MLRLPNVQVQRLSNVKVHKSALISGSQVQRLPKCLCAQKCSAQCSRFSSEGVVQCPLTRCSKVLMCTKCPGSQVQRLSKCSPIVVLVVTVLPGQVRGERGEHVVDRPRDDLQRQSHNMTAFSIQQNHQKHNNSQQQWNWLAPKLTVRQANNHHVVVEPHKALGKDVGKAKPLVERIMIQWV